MTLAIGLVVVAVGLYALYVLADYHGGPREITQQMVEDAQALERDLFPARPAQPAGETDALFDPDPRHLAQVFGRRAHDLIRHRAHPNKIYEAARLAFSYAFQVDPQLRAPKPPRAIVLALPTTRPNLHLVERVH